MTLLFSQTVFAVTKPPALVWFKVNGQTVEIEACREGLQEACAIRKGRPCRANEVEHIEEIPREGEDAQITSEFLIARLKQVNKKYSINTSVASGSDGNGHFFGPNGDFFYSDIQKALEEPGLADLKKSWKANALLGCYTTTGDGCENQWLRFSENMRLAVGFSGWAPSYAQQANLNLVKSFCQNRRDAVARIEKDPGSTPNEITKFLNKLDSGALAASVCARVGDKTYIVGSHDYVVAPGKPAKSLDELRQECPSSPEELDGFSEYKKYFEASEPGYETVPVESSPEEDPSGQVKREYTSLRKAYNDIQAKWFCFNDKRDPDPNAAADQFARPTEDPNQVIRLIYNRQLTDNIVDIHVNEIAEYDNLLNDLKVKCQSRTNCLMSLGILNRGETRETLVSTMQTLQRQIKKLQRRLHSSSAFAFANDPEDVKKMNKLKVALEMTAQFKRTLIDLDWRCSDFSLVHAEAKKRSQCIKSVADTRRDLGIEEE